MKQVDLCIIGAGAGGLSVAAAAVQMGASVVLIEKHKMGGDCLNYGCVPSKALLSVADRAHQIATAKRYGIDTESTQINFECVHRYVHDVIAKIELHDSVERFEQLGVDVILGAAKFIDQRRVAVNELVIQAKRFVIATGSSAVVPEIKGLSQTPFLTNETVFDMKQLPKHLIVIGSGPIGCELAQAFTRLGSEVTLLVGCRGLLPNDDRDHAAIVAEQLQDEGVRLIVGGRPVQVLYHHQQFEVIYQQADQDDIILHATHLLVAAGRQPNLADLNLKQAQVEFQRAGIRVDQRLRTTNKRIFAIGDVIGHYQFTHMAGYHAGIVIRNILIGLPAKVNYHAVPWVTYTDPEIAQVGLTVEQAQQRFGQKVQVEVLPLQDNDRAQAEGQTIGMIKVVVDHKARVLGVSLVGRHAGEQLALWVIAVQKRLKLSQIAGLILPYPTRSEAAKRLAGQYYAPMIFSNKMRWWVKLLMRLRAA